MQYLKYLWLVSIVLIIFIGCGQSQQENIQQEPVTSDEAKTPPVKRFNAEASDEKAITIADKVMEAMGGKQNWENTKIIAWNFFGRRFMIWNKHTGDYRLEIPDQKELILMNVNSKLGRAFVDSVRVQDPDSLNNLLDKGHKIWVNDSYWLFMPFKLKDTGVTLRFVGENLTRDGKLAHVLELNFDSVGYTPQNKYQVYVDKESNLVTQWAFYANAADSKPTFVTPWNDYKKYGNILLSGDRGQRQITDIAVYKDLPESIFLEPESFNPAKAPSM